MDERREKERIKNIRDKHPHLVGDALPHNHTIREIVDIAPFIESVQTTVQAEITDGHDHDGTNSLKVDWGDLDNKPSVFPPDTHAHATSDVTSLQEYIEDTVGGMVSGNTETGITVTYDDSGGKLNFVTATLSADMTAGEALSQYNVVYGDTSTGKVKKAQSDGTVAEGNAIGIVTESGGISNDATGEITFIGSVTNGSWSWTVPGDLYVSATAGGLTQTQPSTGYAKPVGTAVSATTAFFNFQQPGWDADVTYPELLTGFENRTDSTLSLSTRTFTVGGTFNIFSNGTKFAKSGGASCETTIDDVVGLHYIYFDNTGTLQNGTSAWDITSDNIPTAVVYWNGAAGVVYDERHSAYRDSHWHQWAHTTIGTRYISGLDGTFDTSSISVTRGYIADEDIVFDTGATKTDCLVWYRNSTTMTFDATPSAITAKVVGGALKYDNAGSLASVDTSKFVTNWLYCTTETTTPLMLVTGQAQYSTLALARTAPLPTFPNMPTAELKVIYRIIWQNQGGTPTYIESTDYRTASTLPAGGTPTVAAADVTFAASGNIAATNVQAAIEELDTEKATVIHNLIDTTNHPVTGLTTNHVIKATGATTYTFGTVPAGGSDTYIQFNSSGALAGDANLAWDNTNKTLTVKGLVTSGTLGSELLTNPSFATDSDWTKGTGWSISGGQAVHAAGNTAALSQDITVTTGEIYLINVTISGRTAGTITVSLGTVTLYVTAGVSAISATATGSLITTGSTGAQTFSITPTTDWDGEIDSCSVKLVSSALYPIARFRDSDSNEVFAIRGRSASATLYIGYLCGPRSYGATYNVGLGTEALTRATQASYCLAIGAYSQRFNQNGDYNFGLGAYSLYSLLAGNRNIALGGSSQRLNTIGSSNVTIGYNSAYNVTGSSNVIIGESAGYSLYPTGYSSSSSSMLIISNSNTATPLIFGDFSTGLVHIHNDLKVNTKFGLGLTPIARRAHVADPSGGTVQDAEARTAINAILATIEAFGFHATS